MSEAQARDIASQYEVVKVFSDTDTGAYAGIFRNKLTQQLTLAIRGTDGASDWLNANTYLAIGIPPSLNPQFNALRPIVAQWIQSGVIPVGSTIAGHSLGGYLAAALKAASPSTFANTFTFNSPGFAEPLGALPSVLQLIFGMPVPQTGVVDVRASAGLSVIAGLGNHLGSLSTVEVESAGALNPDNHSISHLAQSLAVIKMWSELDPTLSVALSNELIAMASNTAVDTLEKAVEATARFLSSTSSSIAINDSQALYSNVLSLTGKDASGNYLDAGFRSLAGKLKLSPPSTNLASAARTEFASLLSLITLSPVTLKATVGNEAAVESTLQTAWNTAYTDWLADKNLTQADRDAGKETYTAQYLTDRSAMLGWVVTRNQLDVETTEPLSAGPGVQGMHFKDVQSGIELDLGLPDTTVIKRQTQFGGDANETVNGKSLGDQLYGGAGNDSLNGLGGADYLEGNAGADSLNGGDGSDQLLGGVGADTLDGGAGVDNDVLNGGADADLYIVGKDAGVDTLASSDAADRLQLGTRTLDGSGAFVSSSNGVTVWRDSSVSTDVITYSMDTASQVLTVKGADSVVLVKDFVSGDLGIGVPAAADPPPPPPTSTVKDLGQSTTYPSASWREDWLSLEPGPADHVFNFNNWCQLWMQRIARPATNDAAFTTRNAA